MSPGWGRHDLGPGLDIIPQSPSRFARLAVGDCGLHVVITQPPFPRSEKQRWISAMCPSSPQEDKEVISEGEGSSLPPSSCLHPRPWAGYLIALPCPSDPGCPVASRTTRKRDQLTWGGQGQLCVTLKDGQGLHSIGRPTPTYTSGIVEITKLFRSSCLIPTEACLTS